MVRFLLALLVLFLLGVALQDSPPVARFLANFPPAVPAFLRDTRERIMGEPSMPRRAATGPAAAEFGRFVAEVEAHAREVWRTLGTHPARTEKTEPPLPSR
jgi:hypothetical protein